MTSSSDLRFADSSKSCQPYMLAEPQFDTYKVENQSELQDKDEALQQANLKSCEEKSNGVTEQNALSNFSDFSALLRTLLEDLRSKFSQNSETQSFSMFNDKFKENIDALKYLHQLPMIHNQNYGDLILTPRPQEVLKTHDFLVQKFYEDSQKQKIKRQYHVKDLIQEREALVNFMFQAGWDLELPHNTVQQAIYIADSYISSNAEQVGGHMIFVGQTALYMAAKLDEHYDAQMGWPAFERATRDVVGFVELMHLYGTTPEEFDWEDDFQMSQLERHIMSMLSFKLFQVTPSEVVEQLYHASKAALPFKSSSSPYERIIIDTGKIISYLCLYQTPLVENYNAFELGAASILAVFPDNHEQRTQIQELLPQALKDDFNKIITLSSNILSVIGLDSKIREELCQFASTKIKQFHCQASAQTKSSLGERDCSGIARLNFQSPDFFEQPMKFINEQKTPGPFNQCAEKTDQPVTAQQSNSLIFMLEEEQTLRPEPYKITLDADSDQKVVQSASNQASQEDSPALPLISDFYCGENLPPKQHLQAHCEQPLSQIGKVLQDVPMELNISCQPSDSTRCSSAYIKERILRETMPQSIKSSGDTKKSLKGKHKDANGFKKAPQKRDSLDDLKFERAKQSLMS